MFGFLKRKRIDPKQELKRALGSADLPTFPNIIMELLDKVRDETIDLRTLADLVATDPGLSVNLLKTVNSAAFSLRHRVRNVHHAVTLLGRNRLESLLLALSVRQNIPNPKGFDAQRFWEVSAQRAVTARALAEMLHPSTQYESFTGALLQDMAVPLLYQHRAQEYAPLFDHAHNTGDQLPSLEQNAFGWNHAEVASWICDTWKFPETLAFAISAHHDPLHQLEQDAPVAVQLVSFLHTSNQHNGIDELICCAQEQCNLAPDQTQQLIHTSFERAQTLSALFV